MSGNLADLDVCLIFFHDLHEGITAFLEEIGEQKTLMPPLEQLPHGAESVHPSDEPGDQVLHVIERTQPDVVFPEVEVP